MQEHREQGDTGDQDERTAVVDSAFTEAVIHGGSSFNRRLLGTVGFIYVSLYSYIRPIDAKDTLSVPYA